MSSSFRGRQRTQLDGRQAEPAQLCEKHLKGRQRIDIVDVLRARRRRSNIACS